MITSGIHKISDNEYFSLPHINATSLKYFAKTPKNYLWKKDVILDTKSIRFGKLVHQALLEPEIYRNKSVVQPDIDRRTKAGKIEYEKFKELECKGFTLITEEERRNIDHICNEINENQITKDLLSNGKAEMTILWRDLIYGQCKGKIDYLKENQVIDVKTTDDISDSAFYNSVIKYGYDVSAAFYLDGLSNFIKHKLEFFWVAIESKPPFLTRVFKPDVNILQRGRSFYRKYLKTYNECIKKGDWPGYTGITELKLKDYHGVRNGL